ncbi:MAG: hypothetical protein L0922_08180, partial [Candidatus Mariimomonas ferrooxydans]
MAKVPCTTPLHNVPATGQHARPAFLPPLIPSVLVSVDAIQIPSSSVILPPDSTLTQPSLTPGDSTLPQPSLTPRDSTLPQPSLTPRNSTLPQPSLTPRD